MKANEIEQARHAEQRGAILLALHQDYTRRMTSTVSLRRALDLLGKPMSGPALQFHLCLLSDLGYLQIWRNSDMPGWRNDRDSDLDPELLVFSRLLPKGLQLIDGRIPADPAITF